MTRQTALLSRSSPPDRIFPNVSVVVFVVLVIANAVIHETCLPYFKSKMNFTFRAKRKPALDELQCLFQRYFRCGCEQQMEMVGHDDKVMQQKPPLSSIIRKNIDQKLSHAIGLEKRATSGCGRAHEKCTGRLGSLGHSHQG